MIFAPSVYQQRLFDFVEIGSGSAIVKAVAGSGKTTSILECLSRIPEQASVKMFAFNSVIAKELKGRIIEMRTPERAYGQVRACTFHSEGFAAVCRKLGLRPDQIKIDGKKVDRLAKNLLSPADYEMYGEFAVDLVGLAKGEGAGAIVAFGPQQWHDLISHHDLFLEDEEASEERGIELARELLRASNTASATGLIDYDDQLYLPLLWRLKLWQNDWVFVDEAQDTNPVRRAIAKLALKPGGRLVAVGDERQAIYGFTGASHDAMDLIKAEFNCVELPLTVSYRCPQAVVRHAQTLVPYLEAHDGAPEGEVLWLPLWSPPSIVARARDGSCLPGAMDFLTATDAILCRNTAPLIGLAYELIAKQVPCVVLGREIGAGLVGLIKKMKSRNVDGLVTKLEHYEAREVAAFTAKGEEQKAEAIQDRTACIMTVIDHLHENERTLAGLIAKIEGMFDQQSGALTLCTAHKSKGKEWDTVAILRPDLMPSKWARQDWQMLQEENLMYVAWTRAKKRLIFLEEE